MAKERFTWRGTTYAPGWFAKRFAQRAATVSHTDLARKDFVHNHKRRADWGNDVDYAWIQGWKIGYRAGRNAIP